MQIKQFITPLLIWLPLISECQELVNVDTKRYVITELGETNMHIENVENLLGVTKIMGPKIGMEKCDYTHLESRVEDYTNLVQQIEVEGVEPEPISTIFFIDDLGSILEVSFIVKRDSKIDISDLSKMEDHLLNDFGSFIYKDDICKGLNYIRFIYRAKTFARGNY